MSKVYITDAKRSPVGTFGGDFSSISPVELGKQVLEKLINSCPQIATETTMLIVGNVLSAGHGQNIARQIALKAGMALTTPAYTLNQVCGSGLQSIITGVQAIKAGDADIVIAGGVEVMSQAPFLLKKHRWGNKLGNEELIDSLVQDGLWDAFHDVHMGITAETIAMQEDISRDDQDTFAYQSHLKASRAEKEGFFREEIVPITLRLKKEDKLISEDSTIRHETNIEALSKLKPVFDRDGSVTAGNASSINDGAAFVVLMSEEKAKEYADLEKSICIKGHSTVANNPKVMGLAPCKGIETLLEKTKHTIENIDLFEINEAFAAQVLAVQQKLNIPLEKLNINGGAIALGHPIGASGARLIVSLMHSMFRNNAHTSIASLCVGGGQAVSVLLENK
ncbi:thiolase family protein [bacterium]|nr:thiolase family protein [bacterium]